MKAIGDVAVANDYRGAGKFITASSPMIVAIKHDPFYRGSDPRAVRNALDLNLPVTISGNQKLSYSFSNSKQKTAEFRKALSFDNEAMITYDVPQKLGALAAQFHVTPQFTEICERLARQA
jgi:hypothetical protein